MKYFLAFILFLMAMCGQPQTVGRKLVLTSGQQFEIITGVKLNMETEILGKTGKSFNYSTITRTVLIEQPSDTTYLLRSKVTRKTQKLKSSDQDLDFDSDKAADTINNEEWNRFIKEVGRQAWMIINKKGEVLSRDDTTNMEEIDLTGILLPGSTDANSADLIAYLPLKPIKVGDVWQDSVVGEKGKMISHYKLTSLTPVKGVYTYAATLHSNFEIKGDSGKKFKIMFQGTMNAVVSFDPKTGIIKTSEDKVEGSGTLLLSGYEAPYTLKSENTQTIRLK